MTPSEWNATFQRMEKTPGFFDVAEGELLLKTALRALEERGAATIVEIGSYCGRSTVLLGSAAKFSSKKGMVFAVDPHEGLITVPGGVQRDKPTLEAFKQNMSEAGLDDHVTLLQRKSTDVQWSLPIGMLFIDGLHEYEDVSSDFRHFERWLEKGAFVAFHDYGGAYEGVARFVNELLASGRYVKVEHCLGLIVIEPK